jgi:hypothetical protein
LPPEWSNVVARCPETGLLPMSLGAIPQRVRTLGLTAQVSPPSENAGWHDLPAFRRWIEKTGAESRPEFRLLAAGLLQLTGDFDRSELVLNEIPASAMDAVSVLRENERAALLWNRGQVQSALSIWQLLPDSAMSWFNRGVGFLACKRHHEAAAAFALAEAILPGRWTALCGYYRALCEPVN